MRRVRFVFTPAALFALLLIAARPAQAQTETVLYNFEGGSYADGSQPQSRLTADGAGNFYGTTYYGGATQNGTVYELSPNGSGGWNETVLYSFCPVPSCADGANPAYASLIFDSLGTLYGTASTGGAYGYGVVFELTPVGTSWTETVLYSFANAGDGAYPQNGLIFDPAGNLYGTICNCGNVAPGNGGVFELSPSCGRWTEQLIYSVIATSSDAGVTMDAAGNIFGTTISTVFKLSPNGSGGWIPTVIYTFPIKDGIGPEGTPVLDKAGNLYGTTQYGRRFNLGTAYKLSPITKGKKKGQWTEKILHTFKGGKKDGGNPVAGVVLDATGNIYGTTYGGGRFGYGAVFKLVAPVGKGGYKEQILWSFNNPDGAYPVSSLILDGGNLYGTTGNGGQSGHGVAFEVTP